MAAPPRQLRSLRRRLAQPRPSYPLSGRRSRQVQNCPVPSPSAELSNSLPTLVQYFVSCHPDSRLHKYGRILYSSNPAHVILAADYINTAVFCTSS